jgi:hypothetical protein
MYEAGTPPVTAVLYASATTYQNALGPMVSSVVPCEYDGVWPSPAMWPPTGVAALA